MLTFSLKNTKQNWLWSLLLFVCFMTVVVMAVVMVMVVWSFGFFPTSHPLNSFSSLGRRSKFSLCCCVWKLEKSPSHSALRTCQNVAIRKGQCQCALRVSNHIGKNRDSALQAFNVAWKAVTACHLLATTPKHTLALLDRNLKFLSKGRPTHMSPCATRTHLVHPHPHSHMITHFIHTRNLISCPYVNYILNVSI